MAKILVTGGAGYVGCVLVPKLLDLNHEVTVLDNLFYHQSVLLDQFRKNLKFIKADVRKREEIEPYFKDQDFIVHLAAIVGFPACSAQPEIAKSTNVEATKLINELRGDTKIIYPSSGSIYGKLEATCTEESPVNPLTLYSQTKLDAEMEIRRKGNCVILRPATAFGLSPRMRLDLLPNDFTFQAVRMGSLVVYQGGAKRTFIHVSDFANAIIFAINHFEQMQNEVYNLGGDDMNLTKQELAKKIKEVHDYYLHFADIGSDPDERDYEVSYAKLKRVGFTPKIKMEEGIKELISGYNMINLRNPYSNYRF